MAVGKNDKLESFSFQLQSYFSTLARTFQLHSFQLHFEFFKFSYLQLPFPTDMYPNLTKKLRILFPAQFVGFQVNNLVSNFGGKNTF